MTELRMLVGWLRARLDQRDEGGFTAVEWLVIALGVIAIAGIAVAAVQNYVTSQTNKLGNP
jgi:Tfp pilus assembly protein PilE